MAAFRGRSSWSLGPLENDAASSDAAFCHAFSYGILGGRNREARLILRGRSRAAAFRALAHPVGVLLVSPQLLAFWNGFDSHQSSRERGLPRILWTRESNRVTGVEGDECR